MGEAAKKPNSFELKITNLDRHVLYVSLTQTLKCPVCKSGPLDTTDPVKFLKFCKLWNAFELSILEEVSKDELPQFLLNPEEKTITLETDILRFTIEILLSLSNNLNSFVPAIPLLQRLVSIVRENNIKIGNYIEDETLTNKELHLSNDELKLFVAIILSPKRCENIFQLENGATLAHGAPTDHPHDVKEFELLYKALNQLKLLDTILGNTTYQDFTDEKVFQVDNNVAKFLYDLVSRRSTSTGLPPHKFIKIFNKLEEIKK